MLKRSLVWRPAARLRPKGRRFRSRLYGRPGDRLGDLGGSPVTGRRFRVCARGSDSGGSPVLTRLFGGPPRLGPRRKVREFGPCPEGSPEGDNGCGVEARRQIHTDANYQNGGPPLQALTLAPLAPLQSTPGIARRRSGPGGAPELIRSPLSTATLATANTDDADSSTDWGAPRRRGNAHLAVVQVKPTAPDRRAARRSRRSRGAAARPRCRPRRDFASPSRSRRTPIQRRGR